MKSNELVTRHRWQNSMKQFMQMNHIVRQCPKGYLSPPQVARTFVCIQYKIQQEKQILNIA